MTYAYVRKDLKYIQEPQEQSLLTAFLRALYDPTYINQCVDQFAFTAIPEEIRQLGLDGIDTLVTHANATGWTFESNTTVGEGQGDYVISEKRRTFAEYERSELVDDVVYLKDVIQTLSENLATMQAQFKSMEEAMTALSSGETPSSVTQQSQVEYTEENETQLKAALVMSSLSIVFWGVAIGAFFVKYNLGI